MFGVRQSERIALCCSVSCGAERLRARLSGVTLAACYMAACGVTWQARKTKVWREGSVPRREGSGSDMESCGVISVEFVGIILPPT